MNEQTTKLLEQLAAKLGTTSEYLWGILIRQAFVSATTTVIQCAIIWIACYVAYRLHISFSNDDNKMSYYNHDWLVALMLTATVILSILLIVSLFSIEDIINGYFNPEYWALNRVLESVNK